MTPDHMGEVLPVTDILVSVLPATADTLGVANRQIFDALPTHAWFVNVGRGSVVNEDDLVAALHSGSLVEQPWMSPTVNHSQTLPHYGTPPT